VCWPANGTLNEEEMGVNHFTMNRTSSSTAATTIAGSESCAPARANNWPTINPTGIDPKNHTPRYCSNSVIRAYAFLYVKSIL
jgi:hypothetical protein